LYWVFGRSKYYGYIDAELLVDGEQTFAAIFEGIESAREYPLVQIAALRGVDVGILMPEKADHVLAWLSSFSYYAEIEPCGVKLFSLSTGIPAPEGHARR
jgi:hypothetical protein